MPRADARPPDSTSFRPFHAWLTFMASLAFMGNGLDLSVVSFAILGMQAELGLSAADVGYILPLGGIGQLLGAIIMGSLADRIGRRLAFSVTSATAGLGIGLSALSTGPVMLGALLLVGGIGIGGVAPAASALLSELAPPSHRGRMMAWTQVFWVIGWSIAATLGGWFEASIGWRGILAVGGLPILLGILTWLVIPESPRFLLARGQRTKAEALAASLAERHGVLIPLHGAPTRRAGQSLPDQLRAIWGPGLGRRTFALWTTWMAMNAIFSGPVYWLPVILGSLGAANPLQISAYVGYAMLPAAFVSVLLIDSSGRRPLMMTSLTVAGLGALAIAFTSDPAIAGIGGAALSAGALAAWPVALAWASEQYPTDLRGTAAGWAAGVSRLGSAGAPLAIGLILQATQSHTAATLPFALLLLASVGCVAVFAGETANQTLEALTDERQTGELTRGESSSRPPV